MRKLAKLLLIPILLAMLCMPAYAELKISPVYSATATISNAAAFVGIIMKTDGTNNVTINIYNGTSTAGAPLIPTNFVVLGTDYYWSYQLPSPIRGASTSIYVTISVAGGGTCAYQILYSD